MDLEYAPGDSDWKLAAKIFPYNVIIWLDPFLARPSCAPGEAFGSSAPPGDTMLRANGKLLPPDSNVRGVTE